MRIMVKRRPALAGCEEGIDVEASLALMRWKGTKGQEPLTPHEKGALQAIMTDAVCTQHRRCCQGLAATDRCPFCDSEYPETQMRLWWKWPRWKPIRDKYIKAQHITPAQWPCCLVNAGLLPALPEHTEAAIESLPHLNIVPEPAPDRHPLGENEIFHGQPVEVFSDGSVQVPRGKVYECWRRAGQGAYWGPDHAYNFSLPLTGPAQTIGRAELGAALQVMTTERRGLLLRIDNQWVCDGLQVLISGAPPDPLWEHADLWHLAWEILKRRENPVAIAKVKGHLDRRLIEQGRGTWHERTYNDGADEKAKKAVDKHQSISNYLPVIASRRQWIVKVQRMMVEIVMQRAQLLKDFGVDGETDRLRTEPLKIETLARSSTTTPISPGGCPAAFPKKWFPEEKDPFRLKALTRKEDIQVQRSYKWGSSWAQSIRQWAAVLTWQAEDATPTQGMQHVAWVELALDFETWTGLDLPEYRAPRRPITEKNQIDDPLPAATRARVFARMCRELVAVSGQALFPAQSTLKARSLAMPGIPSVAGWSRRPAFAASPRTEKLIAQTFAQKDIASTPRTSRVGAAVTPTAQWGDTTWPDWEGVERGEIGVSSLERASQDARKEDDSIDPEEVQSEVDEERDVLEPAPEFGEDVVQGLSGRGARKPRKRKRALAHLREDAPDEHEAGSDQEDHPFREGHIDLPPPPIRSGRASEGAQGNAEEDPALQESLTSDEEEGESEETHRHQRDDDRTLRTDEQRACDRAEEILDDLFQEAHLSFPDELRPAHNAGVWAWPPPVPTPPDASAWCRPPPVACPRRMKVKDKKRALAAYAKDHPDPLKHRKHTERLMPGVCLAFDQARASRAQNQQILEGLREDPIEDGKPEEVVDLMMKAAAEEAGPAKALSQEEVSCWQWSIAKEQPVNPPEEQDAPMASGDGDDNGGGEGDLDIDSGVYLDDDPHDAWVQQVPDDSFDDEDLGWAPADEQGNDGVENATSTPGSPGAQQNEPPHSGGEKRDREPAPATVVASPVGKRRRGNPLDNPDDESDLDVDIADVAEDQIQVGP